MLTYWIMRSCTAAKPELGQPPPITQCRLFIRVLGVQKVLTVGMVSHGRGITRENWAERCCGTSGVTVEKHQEEGALW